MRRIFIVVIVLGAMGLWGWFSFDFSQKKRNHGKTLDFFSSETEAALVVWNPDALHGLLNDSETFKSMEDSSLWAVAISWIAEAEGLLRPDMPRNPEVPPVVLYFDSRGPVMAAIDGFALNEDTRQALVSPKQTIETKTQEFYWKRIEGTVLLALRESQLPTALPSDPAPMPAVGAKVASLVIRMKSGINDEIRLPDDMLLSAEWEPSEDRWLFYGFARHEPFSMGSVLRSDIEVAEPSFALKGRLLFFGDYESFHSALRSTASDAWQRELTKTEDDCECSVRDVFRGWNGGVVSHFVKADEQVLALEMTNPEELDNLSALVKGLRECDGALYPVSHPQMPGLAFGFSGRFPVCRCSNGLLTFGTSERAIGLYRSAPKMLPLRGEMTRYAASIGPAPGTLAGRLFADALIKIKTEDPHRTYVQIGMGAAQSSSDRQDNILWQAALTADVTTDLFPVTNHYTLETEWFFQDAEGLVHLLGATGKILWSKKLSGKLMGGVTQVDLFKNGKLQLAFGTDKEVFVLDRNGNPTEGFPVKLPAPASGPVGVFDYDRQRDYRLAVPLSDGSIMNLDGKGRPVKGWQYTKAASPAIWIDHFRYGNTDHIVTIHADGTIRSLKRNGQINRQFKAEATGIGNRFTVRKGKSLDESYVVYEAQPGNLRMAVFGQKGYEDMDTPGVDWMLWHYGPINNDSRADLLLIAPDLATLFLQGTETEILLPLSELPSAVPFVLTRSGGDNWLLIDRPESESIICFDMTGGPVEGFPVSGRAPMYASEKNGVVRLISVSESEIVCRELGNQP